jgi:hypothetical protein
MHLPVLEDSSQDAIDLVSIGEDRSAPADVAHSPKLHARETDELVDDLFEPLQSLSHWHPCGRLLQLGALAAHH